jgi:hypothetical protein
MTTNVQEGIRVADNELYFTQSLNSAFHSNTDR